MKIIHLPQVDSTNTYLKENFQNFEDYTFVSCDKQTNGRGRLSRIWESENGKNLLFSLLILDKSLIKHYKEISIITAYSILEVLKALGLKGIKIKWPNDVFVNNKKICGILLEAITKEEIECLIVGVGLNVNQEVFSNDLINEATSIKRELNINFSIQDIKKEIYQKIITNLDILKKGINLYSSIQKYDYLKGKEVFIEMGSKKKRVEVVGISENYSLIVKDDDVLKEIESGEATFHQD